MKDEKANVRDRSGLSFSILYADRVIEGNAIAMMVNRISCFSILYADRVIEGPLAERFQPLAREFQYPLCGSGD